MVITWKYSYFSDVFVICLQSKKIMTDWEIYMSIKEFSSHNQCRVVSENKTENKTSQYKLMWLFSVSTSFIHPSYAETLISFSVLDCRYITHIHRPGFPNKALA